MRAFISLAILGFGPGAIYGLLAQGMVVIYRGSGVLNFAQGAIAMAGGYSLYQLHVVLGWPIPAGLLVITLLSALVGALIQTLVMRPMRRNAPVTRLVATLAVLILLQSAFTNYFGSELLTLPTYLPTRTVTIVSGVYLGLDKIILIAIGILLTILLWVCYRFTQFGRVTQAVAEKELSASVMGHSPTIVATANWAIGCALAGFCGGLIAPLTGLTVPDLTNLVVPAIAAAVLAQFRSFPIALMAGLGIGAVEVEVTRYVSQPGWGDAVPFGVIMLWLVLRGSSLPVRGYVLQRLPALSSPNVKRRYVPVMVVALLVIIAVASFSWQSAILASLVAAVIALSVVVVTGFAGQLSLVAAGIAGCSGLAAAQAASRLGFSFLAALIAGAVVATLAGIIVALPALRTRGVNLAIVTLGFGVFISEVLLNNSDYSGGEAGISLPEPKIFGWSIDALQYPGRYAATVAVVFGVLLMLVLNLRRSRSGRQMIAVRDNERAAASVAVNVAATKVKAFGMAAFIAGLGGVLLVFETTTAVFQVGFDNFTSISVLSFVVLGGIGFASGAVFAGTLQIGGVLSELLSGWTSVNEWLPMIGAAALILQLVTFPDGVIPGNIAVVRAIRERIKKRPHSSDNTAGRTNEADEGANKRLVRSVTLEAIDLRVSFGGAVALAGLSFALAPGEIVGLIGPNGAGKTTAIDALTGFVRSTGSVSMGGHEITHLRPSLRSAGGLIRSFQSIELFDDLTVEENLAVACERSRLGSLAYDLVRPGKVSLSDSAYAVVREFQLDGVLQRMPRELSFAQRRLVGIARAIASGPSTLLLDEPAAGLDAHEIHELGRVIHKVARAWGIGILLVEHDLDMVSRTCDRLIVLHHGQTLASGTTADVLSDADVLRAYVGSFGDDGS